MASESLATSPRSRARSSSARSSSRACTVRATHPSVPQNVIHPDAALSATCAPRGEHGLGDRGDRPARRYLDAMLGKVADF
jgi:hypothetical protein